MANKDAVQRHVDRAIIALEGLEGWQQAAIVLLATKPEHKMTYEEMAAELGISSQTLYRFRQRPDVKDYLVRYDLARVIDRIPDVTEAMIKKAVGGDPLSQKLFYQYAGLLVERRAVEADVNANLVNGTDARVEDLHKELAELRKKFDKNTAE